MTVTTKELVYLITSVAMAHLAGCTVDYARHPVTTVRHDTLTQREQELKEAVHIFAGTFATRIAGTSEELFSLATTRKSRSAAVRLRVQMVARCRPRR